MTILPGETPCLRCVFEAAPAPGEAGTCETAGVLGPIVNIVASLPGGRGVQDPRRPARRDQPRAAFTSTSGRTSTGGSRSPASWARSIARAASRGKFEWLDGEHGAQTTSLCGRNAVQVSHRVAGKLDFETMARELSALGKVSYQQVPAEVRRGRLPVHRLPRRPGDHQGHERRGQGEDAVREVRGALNWPAAVVWCRR